MMRITIPNHDKFPHSLHKTSVCIIIDFEKKTLSFAHLHHSFVLFESFSSLSNREKNSLILLVFSPTPVLRLLAPEIVEFLNHGVDSVLISNFKIDAVLVLLLSAFRIGLCHIIRTACLNHCLTSCYFIKKFDIKWMELILEASQEHDHFHIFLVSLVVFALSRILLSRCADGQ